MSLFDPGDLVRVIETGNVGVVERCDRAYDHYRVVVIINEARRIFESNELLFLEHGKSSKAKPKE